MAPKSKTPATVPGRAHQLLRAAGLAALSLGLLSGCVRLGGGETPKQLYALRAAALAPAGGFAANAPQGAAGTVLAMHEPATSQRLAVPRIPVQITNDSLAYLHDAVWVERPARMFQNLLAETIRANGNRLVINDGDLRYQPESSLSGRLVEMGYDAVTASATVRFDAVLQQADGKIRAQRFASTVPGVAAEADAVAAALNSAANQVAGEVAVWVAG